LLTRIAMLGKKLFQRLYYNAALGPVPA